MVKVVVKKFEIPIANTQSEEDRLNGFLTEWQRSHPQAAIVSVTSHPTEPGSRHWHGSIEYEEQTYSFFYDEPPTPRNG